VSVVEHDKNETLQSPAEVSFETNEGNAQKKS
jgi:hypothetical protein